MVRVADYIVERLYSEGIRHIFMVTGRGILFLSDAVAASSNVKAIPVHHEQAAAFAAVSYSQCNGKLGACLVSTGCASTNTLTGVLCAWQDNIPCIFISGQNKLAQTSLFSKIPLRTFGEQEADIVSIVDSITKYATMLTDPKKVAYELDKALFLASSGRKGPVWIDIPLDIQNARINPDELERFSPPNELLKPSSEDIDYVINCLNEAKRPTFLIGSGVRSADAISELEFFLKKYPVPVTFSSSAVDVYGLCNELSIGLVSSLGGSRAGNFTVQNSDLLIVLGCRLSVTTTGEEFNKFARDAKIIVVDIDKVEHSKNTVRIDRLILSDVKYFLIELMKRDFPEVRKDWIRKAIHWKNIFPKCEDKYKKSEKVDIYYFGDCLSNLLPSDAILVTDSGMAEIILPSVMNLKKGQRYIHPVSQGCMGYALPASIGAYYSLNGTVVAVVGDGSIMMNLQELETISFNDIPIKIIVLNNNGYSTIRTRQVDLFRSRTIGTDSSNGVGFPDFKKVAECFGFPYFSIPDSSILLSRLDSFLKIKGKAICEILAVENQEYLHSYYSRDSTGKAVRRPIEDLFPFLDRDVFLSEMIISPIDQ